MKHNKSVTNGAPSTFTTIQNLERIREVLISKRVPQHLINQRLREYLLFRKLRSLVPPQQQQRRQASTSSQNHEPQQQATELDLEPNEFPEGDCDDESSIPPMDSLKTKHHEGTSKRFVPSIKLKRMEGSILISTIVLKNVSLTSALFGLLEEEKLDIVFENQYRTETRVAHTIQVKVQPGYNVDALEQKLCIWARKHT